MKKIIFLIALCSFFLHGCIDFNEDSGFGDEEVIIEGDVHFWLTTSNEYFLFKEQAVDYSINIGDFTVRLNTNEVYQEMDGFGAALTGSSAYLIRQMDDAKRSALLNELFNPETGAGMNFLRLTIGSSDFSLDMYTYCDAQGIENFAIPEIDKRDLLPVLKEILAINPNVTIMATPWTAPAWMKTNNNMIAGKLKTEYYDDFATYFVKYIQAMKAEGITISALTIQNEAMFESTDHPSMLMEWQEQATIIKDHIGPQFRDNNITTKILILDHNFDLYEYPINVLNDPLANQYIAGTAFHGYAGSPESILQVTAAHPDKDIYFTEQSGGGWNDLQNGRMETMFYYMNNFLIPCVEYGSKNFVMWNLALNSQDGPTTPGGTFCEDCRGVVTINADNSYRKELEFYLLGHFSKVCKPGAKRIGTSMVGTVPANFSATAFLNPDGTKGVVMVNKSGSKSTVTLRNGDKRLTYDVQDNAVISFILD